jgi:hypothetical protein
VKDTAMAHRNGRFYVFFSAFYAERGQVRSHVVEVSTADFKHYSEPIFNFDGEQDGWIGMCSPDVRQLYGKYVMTFNSWGDKPGKPNQLFYIRLVQTRLSPAGTAEDFPRFRRGLFPTVPAGLVVLANPTQD